MSIELPIAPSARKSRVMLRIAVPSWGGPRAERPSVPDHAPRLEDYRRLLDGVLEPENMSVMRLTKAERRQLTISRRVRDALYGSASPV